MWKTRFWTEPRHCMVLGLKPMGKPTTWMWKTRFWTEPRHCMVLGPKPMGKPTTWMRKTRFWTEPRHCMALGPKPMGKPTTWMRKTRCLDRTKALHGPRTQAYGETNYLDEKKFGFRKIGYLIKMLSYLIPGLNTVKG